MAASGDKCEWTVWSGEDAVKVEAIDPDNNAVLLTDNFNLAEASELWDALGKAILVAGGGAPLLCAISDDVRAVLTVSEP